MLGNVYIQVYILGKDSQILCRIQRNHLCLISKQLGRIEKFKKGLNGQNHSTSDSHHHITIPLPA